MAQKTLLAPQTAAVSTQVQFAYGNRTVISAGPLAGAETVPVYMLSGAAWIPVVILTVSSPAVELAGGPTYGFLKDLTATACGVYLNSSS